MDDYGRESLLQSTSAGLMTLCKQVGGQSDFVFNRMTSLEVSGKKDWFIAI
jgi:hypothetical protein